MNEISRHEAARALLRWHAEMGVDEAVGAVPADWFTMAAPAAPAVRPSTPSVRKAASEPRPAAVFPAGSGPLPADEAVTFAQQAAASAADFEALAKAVAAFEHCPLKAGARSTVFADGVPGSDLLVIGEAPGRDEDLIGRPFVGRAGQLLDRMLAAIGRSRETNTLISNVIFWRPPGNRTPTKVEIAICKPFVERLIELTAPKAVLLAGGAPMGALLGLTGVMRARGTWRDIETPGGFRVPALPMFHPAFLLRQPAEKRLAWNDLLSLERKLTDD